MQSNTFKYNSENKRI